MYEKNIRSKLFAMFEAIKYTEKKYIAALRNSDGGTSGS